MGHTGTSASSLHRQRADDMTTDWVACLPKIVIPSDVVSTNAISNLESENLNIQENKIKGSDKIASIQ